MSKEVVEYVAQGEIVKEKLKIVASLNPFNSEIVETSAPAGFTIRQIVGPKCPENVEVWVNGEHIERELWEDYIPEPGSFINIKVIPGRGVLRALLLLAVIFVAVYLSTIIGPEAAALIGITSEAGILATSSIIAAALFTAGTLLVNAIIPPSKPDTGSEERIFSLTGARNRVGAFAPIPRLYGKMKYFPPIPMTGLPYTEIVGNYTYLRVLYVLGYGPLEIAGLRVGGPDKLTLKDNPQIGNEIFIGETPLSNFEDVEVEIGEHDKITLYTNSVFQQNLNIAMNSANQQPKQTVTDNISNIRTTEPDTEEIVVDIEFPTGLFSIDKKGNNVVSTVTFKIEYSPAGANQWTDAFTQTNVNNPGSHQFWYDSWLGSVSNEIATEVPQSNTYPNMVIRGSERKTLRRTFRWKVPKGQYDVRVTRVQTYNSGKSLGSTDAVWTTLKSIKYIKPFTLQNIVLMAMRIKATDQISGTLDNVSIKATAKLPVWDGTTWVEQTTRNPAWAYVDLLSGTATRNPIDKDVEIDKNAIKDWADWCDTNGFYFDVVFDNNATLFERLQLAAAAGRAAWAYRDNKFSIIREETGQVPVQMFTPRNTSGFTYEKLFTDIPHAFRVKFVDPNTYEDTERFVYDDGFDETNATKFQELQLIGVTDPDQAYKLGRFHLAQAKLRPERYTFTVPLEHLIVQRGDAAILQHDTLLVGLAAGRIKSVTRDANNQITSFVSDQELNMDAGKTYGIKIRYLDSNGALKIVNTQIQTVTPSTFTVTPINPLPADIKEGDLFVHGEFGTETIDIKILSIVPKADLTAEVVAVPLAPAILTADQGPIPPYNPFITKPTDPTTRVPPQPSITQIQSDSKVLVRDIDGSLRARILITFDLPNIDGYTGITVECRYTNKITPENWRYVEVKAETKEISIIDGIEEGQTYEIQLRAKRGNLASAWTTKIEHLVIGKDSPPSDVANFTGSIKGFDIILTWDHIDDLDRKEYEIREGTSWDTATVLLRTTDNQVKIPNDSNTTRTFLIKAIDTSGNFSVNAVSTTVDATIATLPDDVVEISVPNIVKGDTKFLKGIEELSLSTLAGDAELLSTKFPLQRLGVTAGKKAALTIECYHTGGGNLSALAKFYDSNNTFINEGDSVKLVDTHSNTTTWQIARTWFIIPANATQVEVGVRRTGGSAGVLYARKPTMTFGWIKPPIVPPTLQDANDIGFQGLPDNVVEDFIRNNKGIDLLGEGITYGRVKQISLTTGQPDLSKSVLNKSLDYIADSSLFAKVEAQDLTNNRLDFSKPWLNKHLDNLTDGTTFKRVKGTALTNNQPDLALSGILNKTADQIAESATRKWAAVSGADITYPVQADIALTTSNANQWVRVFKWTGFQGRGAIQGTLANSGGSIEAFSITFVAGVNWNNVPTLTITHSSGRSGLTPGLRVVNDINAGASYLEILVPNIGASVTPRAQAREIFGSGISTGSLTVDLVYNTTVPSGASVTTITDATKPFATASTDGNFGFLRDGRVSINEVYPLDIDGKITANIHPFDRMLNRTADQIAESATRKWAAESGAEKTTGKSIDILIDGSTYGRIRKNAMTNGNPDLALSGILNKTADQIAETPTRKWAADSGATKSRIFRQSTEPTGQTTHDIWADTISNKMKRWDGSQWLDIGSLGAPAGTNVDTTPAETVRDGANRALTHIDSSGRAPSDLVYWVDDPIKSIQDLKPAEAGATATGDQNLYSVETDGMVSSRTIDSGFPVCIFGNPNGSRWQTGDATQIDVEALNIAVGEAITLSADVTVSGDTSDATLRVFSRWADASDATIVVAAGETVTGTSGRFSITTTRPNGGKYVDYRVGRVSGTSNPTITITRAMASRGSQVRPYVRPTIEATKGAPAGTLVDTTPAESVRDGANRALTHIDSSGRAPSDLVYWVDEPSLSIQELKPAEPGATKGAVVDDGSGVGNLKLPDGTPVHNNMLLLKDITVSQLPAAGAYDGEWKLLDGTPPVWYQWDASTSSWVKRGAASLSELDPPAGSKLGGIEDGATKSRIFRQGTAPSNPTLNDIWYDTTTLRIKRWDGSQWLDIGSLGAPAGTNVDSTPAESVRDGANRALTHIDSSGRAPSDLVYWVDEPSLSIQDLKPAEAGARKDPPDLLNLIPDPFFARGASGLISLNSKHSITSDPLGVYPQVITMTGDGGSYTSVIVEIDVYPGEQLRRWWAVSKDSSATGNTGGDAAGMWLRFLDSDGNTVQDVFQSTKWETIPVGSWLVEQRDCTVPSGAVKVSVRIGNYVSHLSGNIYLGALRLTRYSMGAPAGTLVDTTPAETVRQGADKANVGLDASGVLASGIHPLDRLTGRTANKITFAGGETVEALKPAEAGSTKGAPAGTNVGSTPSTTVEDGANRATVGLDPSGLLTAGIHDMSLLIGRDAAKIKFSDGTTTLEDLRVAGKGADILADGATKRVTTLAEATGAGRAYNAIDGANKLQTGTTASATINATPASSVEDGATRATTAIRPDGTLESGIHPFDRLTNRDWGLVTNRPVELTDGRVSSAIGSDARLTDAKRVRGVQAAGLGASFSVRPITGWTDTGSAAQINLQATTLQVGGSQVSYPAGSVGGLAYNTTYHIYRDDPALNGGGTYLATTSLQTTTASEDRVYFGSYTTGSPGGSGGGTPPPANQCIAADQWLPGGLRGHHLRPGHELVVLTEDLSGIETARVERAEEALAECVEIVTTSGARLVCSTTTPLTLRDGSVIRVPQGLGKQVPVIRRLAADDGWHLTWEPIIELRPAGSRTVIHVYAGGRTFAASADPAAGYILTHNGVSKP